MGNSQRRFRRGRLQVQRHRTRAGSSRHGGISGSENAISCRKGLGWIIPALGHHGAVTYPHANTRERNRERNEDGTALRRLSEGACSCLAEKRWNPPNVKKVRTPRL